MTERYEQPVPVGSSLRISPIICGSQRSGAGFTSGTDRPVLAWDCLDPELVIRAAGKPDRRLGARWQPRRWRTRTGKHRWPPADGAPAARGNADGGRASWCRSRRAFRRRSPRVMPLPLPTGRPLRCDWDTKPGLSHQEDVPASTTSRRTTAPSALSYYYGGYLLRRLRARGRHCGGPAGTAPPNAVRCPAPARIKPAPKNFCARVLDQPVTGTSDQLQPSVFTER